MTKSDKYMMFALLWAILANVVGMNGGLISSIAIGVISVIYFVLSGINFFVEEKKLDKGN